MKSYKLSRFLLLLSFIISCSIGVRFYLSGGSYYYTFLIWNLFLAWIPYIISTGIIKYHYKFDFGSAILLGVWLLFFPNAPYIITDLLHLTPKDGIPLWFDILMICGFAGLGLLIGLLSLYQVFLWFSAKAGKRFAFFIITIVSMLSGFAIYIGRYQRWNSWDLLRNPIGLIQDVIELFINHRSNDMILFTLLFGGFVFCSFIALRSLLTHNFEFKNSAEDLEEDDL